MRPRVEGHVCRRPLRGRVGGDRRTEKVGARGRRRRGRRHRDRRRRHRDRLRSRRDGRRSRTVRPADGDDDDDAGRRDDAFDHRDGRRIGGHGRGVDRIVVVLLRVAFVRVLPLLVVVLLLLLLLLPLVPRVSSVPGMRLPGSSASPAVFFDVVRGRGLRRLFDGMRVSPPVRRTGYRNGGDRGRSILVGGGDLYAADDDAAVFEVGTRR